MVVPAAGNLKVKFAMRAAAAAKLGRTFLEAAKAARNTKTAEASTRIAARLLRRAR